jgi:surfactin synthase thioesterase subunit/3-oxoacyl-(acyl-carrier-protein) synthase/acyl carrier protein
MTTELATLQKALLAIKKLKQQLKEQPTKPIEPIAIIGLSCRFPSAIDKNEFWQLLVNKRNIIKQMPTERWQLLIGTREQALKDENHTYWGGYLDGIENFDAYFFGITPREAIQMDPHQRLLMQVSYEAVEDAGIPLDLLAGSNTGVFTSLYTRQTDSLTNADLELDALYLPTGNAISIAANRLSYFFDLHGPSLVIDTACSSSFVALHLACLNIQTQQCDQALVCGAHLNLNPSINLILSKAHMLSSDGQCHTFDTQANGYVQGEGIGSVILKPLSKALQNQDRIYAVVTGSAVNQDGKTNGLTAPNGLQQETLLKTAYANAGISPCDISYVECHGTGTLLGDPIELQALGKVISANRPSQNPCWIGSVKTNLGHLEPAAGMASIIKTALALKHAQIPPHLNFSTPNSYIAFDKFQFRIPQETIAWPKYSAYRAAGISGFGFGGTNAHIVLRELFPEESPKAIQTDSTNQEVFTISAKNKDALYHLIDRWCTYLANNLDLNLSQICYNTHVRRTHYSYRLAIVVTSTHDLYTALSSIKSENVNLSNSEHIFLNLSPKANSTQLSTEKIFPIDATSLAKMYVENNNINWHQYEKTRIYPCIDMPYYPWQNKSYWPVSKNTMPERKQSFFYPFNSKKIESPLNTQQFEFIFHTDALPEIQDTYHVLHAGYYLDMLAFVVKALHQQTIFTIENLSFLRALIIPNNTKIYVQIILDFASDNSTTFSFYSRNENEDIWHKHAEGKLLTAAETKQPRIAVAEIRKRCTSTENVDNLYNRITSMGMPAGNSIRWTQQYWLGNNEILCEFKQPKSITANEAFSLNVHPGIIDGSIQPIFKALPATMNNAFMAKKIERIAFYGIKTEPYYLHSILNNTQTENNTICSSWDLFNKSGNMIVKCENIILQPLEHSAQNTTLAPTDFIDNFKLASNPREQKQYIIDFLIEIIAQIFSMPKEDINIQQSLQNMGMNSLSAMSLINVIETNLKVRYPLNLMWDNPTIEKIADFVINNAQSSKTAEKSNPFIYYRKIQPQAEVRLFCFPYGGAGASIYRDWQRNLPDTIEICPIQLPGRENRLDEKPITDINILVNLLLDYLKPEFNLPFAFFGHSFGALLAFELTHRLRQQKLPQPFHLFASAFPAPNTPTDNLDHLLKELQNHQIYLSNTDIELTDEQLKYLAIILNEHGVFEYKDYIENKEVIKILLPCFIGDMQLVKSYQHKDAPPLDIPITVFWSNNDPWVPANYNLKWQEHTRSTCEFYEFNSGHLFIKENAVRSQILQHINSLMLNNIPSDLCADNTRL